MKREINMRNKSKKGEGSVVQSFATNNSINTDPDGMWTGVSTMDELEKPVQDVDDL